MRADDGIRAGHVTGVQTCALPILLDLRVHDLREWTTDRHRTVDDTPFGGGAGMVMRPDVWGTALDAVLDRSEERRVGNGCRSWVWARQRNTKRVYRREHER